MWSPRAWARVCANTLLAPPRVTRVAHAAPLSSCVWASVAPCTYPATRHGMRSAPAGAGLLSVSQQGCGIWSGVGSLPCVAPLGGVPTAALGSAEFSPLSWCRPLGFIRLRADRSKRLIAQGRGKEAPRLGEVSGSRFRQTVLPLQSPPGGMLPAAGSLPCSFGKVSRLSWRIPYIIHAAASWRLGYSRIPGTGTAPPTRGVRERQEQLPGLPRAGSTAPAPCQAGGHRRPREPRTGMCLAKPGHR